MAKKKWFGIGAVVAAIGAATALIVRKAKESPEKASEIVHTVSEKSKEGTKKIVNTVGAAVGAGAGAGSDAEDDVPEVADDESAEDQPES